MGRRFSDSMSRALSGLVPLFLLTSLTACEKEATKQPTKTSASAPSDSPKSTSAQTSPDTKKAAAAPTQSAADLSPVYDLVDNRHLAHFSDGGLVIDFGVGAGLKYVQGRWKNPWFDTSTDGARFAYPKGIGATVRFPLGVGSGKTDKTYKLQARLRPVGDQRCDVFLNAPGQKEQKFASLSLEEGWKTYTITLPEGLELGQEHSVRFHFSRSRDVAGVGKSAAAFDWIRVGKDLSEESAPARAADLFDASGKKIELAKNQSLSWYTTLAPKTAFHAAAIEGKATLTIDEDGKPSKNLELAPGATRHDLSAWGDRAVRITLSTGSAATLTAPALSVPRSKPTPRGEAPQYVVVWLIDTLRADHLPAYNSKSDVKTPALDAFSNEAARFARAAVQGNSSLPSSASIFSGAYPPSHGVIRESARLSKDSVLLGEGMKKAGWKNGLFSSNGYVSNKWGFARGFDTEFNPIREGSPSEAENLWPKAKEWLAAQIKEDKDGKVFVYLNTSDPHVPYDPPAEDLKLYHDGGQVGRVSPRGTGELLHDMAKPGAPGLNGAEQAYMRALYKGEITYNDRWFGKMIEDLKTLGILDKTMIIVTSDHGEEFNEYGRYGHGISVNQELVDVPLIIGYSPWTKGGVVVEHAAEVLDIYPTLLDAAGVPVSDFASNVQGRSLVNAMLSPTTSHPTPTVSYHNDFLRSVRIGDWKYQLFQGDNDPLYAISYHPTRYEDYRQAKKIDDEDVSTSRPIVRRQMRDVMAFHLRYDTDWQRTKDGAPNNHTAARATALDGSW